MVSIRTIFFAATLLFAGGCYSLSPHEGSSLEPVDRPDADWPRPPADRVDALIARLPSTRTVESGAEVPVEFIKTPEGLLRLHPEPNAAFRRPQVDPTRPMFRRIDPIDGRFLTQWHASVFDRIGEFEAEIRAEAGTEMPDRDPERPPHRFTDVGLTISLPDKLDPAAKGLVLHLPATNTTSYEHEVTEHFERRGWAVARLRVATSISEVSERWSCVFGLRLASEIPLDLEPPPIPEDTTPEEQQRFKLQASKAIMAELDAQVDLALSERPPYDARGLDSDDHSELETLGQIIAHDLDRIMATNAYAASALIEAIEAKAPWFADRPLIICGFSAGAVAAPTIASHLINERPDRTIALVLIGGGVNIFEMSQNSTFTDGDIRLRKSDEPRLTPDVQAAINDAYVRTSYLDPIHTVKAVRNVPTLHAYATSDTWVPTPNGNQLNRLHGNLDQLVHDGDHQTLFFFIPGQASRLVRWAERAVQAP
ncbi:MAG: hypothetical protein AAGI53_08045 [Planctomycetota bacterium]